MENEWSWEQSTLINELIQGMEVARKLKADLKEPYSVDTKNLLVQRILSSYEKALLILRYNASTPKLQTMNQATATMLPESPISVSGSPPREDLDGAIKDHQEVRNDSKKRKITPKWVDQIKVSCDSGFEGPHEDGYNWRKYGQKDILGAKYPRSYYRCTFRNTQGCWATKQVQRSDEDPTVFDITYRGKHTCSQENNAAQAPKSPDKQKKQHSHNIDTHSAHASQESLARFGHISALSMENGEMAYPFSFPPTSFGCITQENNCFIPTVLENEPFLNSLSQANLLAPITPESNYFSSPTFQMTEFDGIYNKLHSESDVNEIISTNNSATNSPIPEFNFSLDPVEIDPNFPFNTPGFFS